MKYWIIITFSLISNRIISLETDNVYLSLALIEKQVFQSKDVYRINALLFEKSNLQVENNQSQEAIRTLERTAIASPI